MKQQKHIEVWNQTADCISVLLELGIVSSRKVPQVEYVDHHIEIPVAKHVPLLQNLTM